MTHSEHLPSTTAVVAIKKEVDTAGFPMIDNTKKRRVDSFPSKKKQILRGISDTMTPSSSPTSLFFSTMVAIKKEEEDDETSLVDSNKKPKVDDDSSTSNPIGTRECSNNKPSLMKDSTFSQAKSSFSVVSNHHLLLKDLAIQIENKRYEFQTATDDYAKAQEAEAVSKQNVSVLTLRQRELERELASNQEKLTQEKSRQMKFLAITKNCSNKKTKAQEELDSLHTRLNQCVGIHSDDIFQLKNRVTVPSSKITSGHEKYEEVDHSAIGLKPMEANAFGSKTVNGDEGVGPKPTSDEVKKKKAQDWKRKVLIGLVRDSIRGDKVANTKLIKWVTSASLSKLRKALIVPTRTMVLVTHYNTCKDILRVLHYGNFHSREDFRFKIKKDIELRDRMLPSKGSKILIDTGVGDMQARLVELLDIPEDE